MSNLIVEVIHVVYAITISSTTNPGRSQLLWNVPICFDYGLISTAKWLIKEKKKLISSAVLRGVQYIGSMYNSYIPENPCGLQIWLLYNFLCPVDYSLYRCFLLPTRKMCFNLIACFLADSFSTSPVFLCGIWYSILLQL